MPSTTYLALFHQYGAEAPGFCQRPLPLVENQSLASRRSLCGQVNLRQVRKNRSDSLGSAGVLGITGGVAQHSGSGEQQGAGDCQRTRHDDQVFFLQKRDAQSSTGGEFWIVLYPVLTPSDPRRAPPCPARSEQNRRQGCFRIDRVVSRHPDTSRTGAGGGIVAGIVWRDVAVRG